MGCGASNEEEPKKEKYTTGGAASDEHDDDYPLDDDVPPHDSASELKKSESAAQITDEPSEFMRKLKMGYAVTKAKMAGANEDVDQFRDEVAASVPRFAVRDRQRVQEWVEAIDEATGGVYEHVPYRWPRKKVTAEPPAAAVPADGDASAASVGDTATVGAPVGTALSGDSGMGLLGKPSPLVSDELPSAAWSTRRDDDPASPSISARGRETTVALMEVPLLAVDSGSQSGAAARTRESGSIGGAGGDVDDRSMLHSVLDGDETPTKMSPDVRSPDDAELLPGEVPNTELTAHASLSQRRSTSKNRITRRVSAQGSTLLTALR